MAEAKQATKPTSGNGAVADQFPSSIVRVLQGVTIEAPTKFKPGHKLSYDEALFASTAHIAAARSAFEDQAKTLRADDRVDADGKKIGPASDDEFRTAWSGYYNDYVWSPRGDATPLDPTEAEMRKIARAEVDRGLKAKNLSWPQEKDKREFILSGYITKHSTRLRKAAEQNLATVPVLSEDLLAHIQAVG